MTINVSFKVMSAITAAISSLLFLSLLLFPEALFFLFQLETNESAFIIARRAAMLFLGLAVMVWTVRDSLHSEARQAICFGLSIMMLALASMGIFEYWRNAIGEGIFLAVLVELVLGLAYWRLWKQY